MSTANNTCAQIDEANNAQSRTYIALDLGGTKIAGALVCYENDLQAPTLLYQSSIPTDAHLGGDSVRKRLAAFASKLKALSEETPLGIGIGAAGVVNPQDGSIAFANDIMPGWTGQPVRAYVEEICDLPCVVMGDVHAHALGESRWGAARNKQSCLCVAAGTGIGGAFVYEGKVMTGFHGAAGHVGHVQSPHAASLPCACGAESHLESIASGTGIGRLFGLRFPERASEVHGGADVSRLAQAGDENAIAILHEAGCALGEALGSWTNIFDPEVIVLSGSVLAAGSAWRKGVTEGFVRQAMPFLASTPIVDATLEDGAPLVGAAERIRDTLNCS